jgi:predicted Zn finger-like uncharacterized protein
MAVMKITCPECQSVLRPAKPLPAGKTVKCPECGARFNAPAEAPGAAVVKPNKAGPPDAPKPKRPAAAKSAPQKPAVKKPAATKDDDDDDGGATYGFVVPVESGDKPEIEYAPDMSIKDLRGPAQSALVFPTNMMILVGALGFFGWLGLLILILIPTLTPVESDVPGKNDPPKAVIGLEHGLGAVNDDKDPGPDLVNDPARKSMYVLFGINFAGFGTLGWAFTLILLPIIIGMVYSAFVTFGAVRVQNLSGYRWGITSCIMMMIPIHSAGFMAATSLLLQLFAGMVIDDRQFMFSVVIGLMVVEKVACIGVAAWGLATLLSKKVVAGFEYKAE